MWKTCCVRIDQKPDIITADYVNYFSLLLDVSITADVIISYLILQYLLPLFLRIRERVKIDPKKGWENISKYQDLCIELQKLLKLKIGPLCINYNCAFTGIRFDETFAYN